MFPLLLYVPPLLGFDAIPVKNITGLTMMQGFFASFSAMLFYHRQRLVSKALVLTFGLCLFVSSLVGSVLSKWMSDAALLLIFGILALVASIMMFVPRNYANDDMRADSVRFNRFAAAGIAAMIGITTGMIGQGGAFIIIPFLLYALKIPLRVALGSTLAIGLFSSTAGLAGKIATQQVPFVMAPALISGAVLAARAGGWVGQRTNTKALRWLLAFIISAAALKVLSGILLK